MKIRETIYESLSPELRREYHGLLAAYIEEQNGGNLDAVAPILGLHYYYAGVKGKALPHLLVAGNRALENFAAMEAARFYQHAMDCIDKEKQRDLYVECLGKLGEIHALSGNYEKAIECFSNAVNDLYRIQPLNIKKLGELHMKIGEVYEKTGRFDEAIDFCMKAEKFVSGDNKELRKIISFEGLIYMRKGEYGPALEKLENALKMSKEEDHKKEIGLIYRRMGTIHMYLGNTQEAVNLLKLSLQISEEINDIEGIGKSSNNLGIVYYGIGELDLALKYFEKSMEIAKKIGDTYGIGLSYLNIGNVHQDKGNLEQAIEFYGKGLQIKEKIGDIYGVALVYNALGSIYLEKWELETAQKYLTNTVKLQEKIGDNYGLSLSYISLGHLHKKMDKLNVAITYYEKAMEIAKKSGSKELMCVGLSSIAEVLAKQQKFEDAMECMRLARAIIPEIGSDNLEALYYRTLGIVKREAGLFDDSDEAFNKALSLYEKMNMALEIAKTCYEYGLMLSKRQTPSDRERAKEYLERALKIFEEKNITKWSEQIFEINQNISISEEVGKARYSLLPKKPLERELMWTYYRETY
ncbi:MAG: tetratricopeptide repeat protein [Thermoplasmata archaeon]